MTGVSFRVPDDFDAKKYFSNTIGIYVDSNQRPQKVTVRAYGVQVEYLRTLPLHASQKEILTKHEQYSDFQYRLCLTPELTTQLLAMGENVEVLEPQELKDDIKNHLLAAINRYKAEKDDGVCNDNAEQQREITLKPNVNSYNDVELLKN